MVQDAGPKKSYSSPSFQVLDTIAAKVKLESIGIPLDHDARAMLSAISEQIDEQTALAPPASLNLVRNKLRKESPVHE